MKRGVLGMPAKCAKWPRAVPGATVRGGGEMPGRGGGGSRRGAWAPRAVWGVKTTGVAGLARVIYRMNGHDVRARETERVK